MAWWRWSQTANANGNADPAIAWPEGMAPSQINDSARAMMAETAKYRDDIAGAIVTAGTSTAYTVSSYSAFDTLAHLDGQVIAFTPHITNGATVTLSVDGLGAKSLRTAPNVELLPGTIIQGASYTALYNNTDGAFYLRSFFGVPPAFSTGDLKPTLKTTPDVGWVMGGAQSTIGNAGSGANYANVAALALYTLIWNNIASPTANAFCPVTGGLGASAAADWAGLKPISTGWYSSHALGFAGGGGALTTRPLGSNVGSETATLTATNLPSITSSGNSTTSDLTLTSPVTGFSITGFSAQPGGQIFQAFANGAAFVIKQLTAALGVTSTGTNSTPFPIMPPMFYSNVMIKL